MFRHIMVPVDLGHTDRLDRALNVAADLGCHFGARITYVGVTSNVPTPVAHTPEEFAQKLSHFAATQGELHGITDIATHAVISHDPAVDMDRMLVKAADDVGADLVIMGSHIPRHFDFGSHGGRLASHSDISVMLVRDG